MNLHFLTLILGELVHQVISGPVTNFLKCTTETEVPESKSFGVMKIPDLHDAGQCFSSCLMRSIGVIDERGKISPQKIMEIVRNYTSDTATIGKGEIVVMRCGIEANQEDETCATILTFNRCVQVSNLQKPESKLMLPENISITLPPITFVLAMLSLL